ncbi:hypothetical protein [Sphingobacterium sp. IITKGP-BTPF85]|uniref:hypothetical protein n=1 Tax=Sphingobacterium sp. IITKGP-BTPF85 TaxID=1338009 RepID=UPI00038A06D1|nr:hypothetical protein [Sphingobacterium sp. IITKGP-BTPF85]KKX51742.1 hypothetical protein L950_0203805 [Sphingobacterium sp. IITKGP-BTPF85]
MFKIKKSKEIFLVGSNDKQSLIVAAKRNNIIVNELQHGLNSDKDVILNYPYTVEESLEYFPNHFYKWNNVEMFFAKLPLKSDNIFEIPNYHLEFMIESTKTISRDAKSVLIISQPHGSKEILRFILNNISELDSYKIIYKIHPTEDFNKSIEDQFVDHKNIHFVRNEESIYALMKKCEFVVGIYSSSLYEAVVFNCSIILLKLPGVEMSLNLLKNSKCKLMDINDRLLKFMIDKI